MIGSCKNIIEIQNDRNKIDSPSLILILFIIQDGLFPIMAADVFVTHEDMSSVVMIGIEQARLND